MSLHELQTRVHVAKPPNGALSKWIMENAKHDGDECLLWPFSISTLGYPGNTLWNGKQMFGHRAMCFAAHGHPKRDQSHAAHRCGNRWCINPNHLRWASVSENQMDRVKHGTSNRGGRHGSAKLCETSVLRIYKSRRKIRALAAQYCVSRKTISDIKNGSTWSWLTGEGK